MDFSDPTGTLIDLALAEDLGHRGDVTSQAFIPADHRSEAAIVSREHCVLSGGRVVAAVFAKVDPGLHCEAVRGDGEEVLPGDVVFRIEGSTRSILTAERTALNFLQRLSGCATLTRQFQRLVGHTKVRLLDTRKTTPGWRLLEKKAVADGGGQNHRMGLYDAVMIKDNHLAAHSDPAVIERQMANLKTAYPELPVIIEADRLEQVDAFLRMRWVDRILLDNMSIEQLRSAVERRDRFAPHLQLEASGGVTLDTVASIAETGVDFISVGALTHSYQAVDFGLEILGKDQ